MIKKSECTTLMVWIPPEEKTSLKYACVKDKRNMSQFVRMAIKERIERLGEDDPRTSEA